MRYETRYIDGLSGMHHYVILDDQELKDLARYGIICIELGREDSYYIVTEEEWNKNFREGEEK